MTLASRNPGKLTELAELCRGVLDLVPLPADDRPPMVTESGETYLENAVVKARAISGFVGGWVLGDDSGIEVDALGGAPGVRSARYGGEGLNDAERAQRLLDELAGVSNRRARFRCVLALVRAPGPAPVLVPPPGAEPVLAAVPAAVEGGEAESSAESQSGVQESSLVPADLVSAEIVAEGVLEGEIAARPRGSGGFGYDPIFIAPGFGGRTVAELSAEEKDRISHRAIAMRGLIARLEQLGLLGAGG